MDVNGAYDKQGTGGAAQVDSDGNEVLWSGVRTCPMCGKGAMVRYLTIDTKPHLSQMTIGVHHDVPSSAGLVEGRCVLCNESSWHLHNGEMVWPQVIDMPEPHPAMPEHHHEIYNAARVALKVSPFRAPTALMRIWLEDVLMAQGYEDGKLDQKIERFASEQASVGTRDLLKAFQWIGNSAVHPHEKDHLLDFGAIANPRLVFEAANHIAEDIWGKRYTTQQLAQGRDDIIEQRQSAVKKDSAEALP